MKFIWKLVIVLFSLVGIVLITALFVDGDFTVSRKVTINKSKDDVYNYVKYLDNQQKFAVWQAKDPKTKTTNKGTDGTVGYIYSWKSDHKDVGHGEQEIMKMVDGKSIDYALRFTEPMEMESTAKMVTKSLSADKTEVTWSFSGSSPYPFNVFFLFMDMDKEMGPDLQKGLDNLKGILESAE